MATFKEKVKGFFQNKAAVTVTTLIVLALITAITFTVVLNRSKKPTELPPDNNKTPSTEVTKAPELKTSKPAAETDAAIHYNSGEKTTVTNAPQDKPTSTTEKTKYVLPVSGTLAKEHDASIQVWSATTGDYRVHLGIDISADDKTPVCAAAAGKVSKIWNDPMMGVCVAITHDNNTCTVYKNLSENLAAGIKEGADVTCGQNIGNIGESAVLELADEPHLHFEMTVNGISVDPLQYLDSESVATLAKDTAYEDEDMTEYTEYKEEITTFATTK